MASQQYIEAIKKADEVRRKLGLNIFQPLNIFDACNDLDLTVRFVDINMEGMYISQNDGKNPTILLSNQRPLPRRSFTCAHELGHHVFCHGTTIDSLSEENTKSSYYDEREFLADAFAGALLMPVAGIQAEFVKRNWKPDKVSIADFYTICCVFGIGYETLIMHCSINKVISETTAQTLRRHTPARILKNLFQSDENVSHFKIIDNYYKSSVIDLEVSNYIILPPDIHIEGAHFQEYKDCSLGKGYIAVKPGIVRAVSSKNNVSYFIRIQNTGYIGLAENRHLENID